MDSRHHHRRRQRALGGEQVTRGTDSANTNVLDIAPVTAGSALSALTTRTGATTTESTADEPPLTRWVDVTWSMASALNQPT